MMRKLVHVTVQEDPSILLCMRFDRHNNIYATVGEDFLPYAKRNRWIAPRYEFFAVRLIPKILAEELRYARGENISFVVYSRDTVASQPFLRRNGKNELCK
ncbi:MAG: hypothetical protein D3906_12865 [Candidatus Electrothrix sp. AUS1_2]|nr:hypothetical protein [Candidatus Electrothrix sp. AUS1_2]